MFGDTEVDMTSRGKDTAPAVSVVMAVHNGEKYLHPAVDSILGQTLSDFEFLIVDDASTDRSPDILHAYSTADSRIRVLTNSRNFGLAASLNRAVAASRGALIARMDADDVSHATRLERQVSFLSTRSEVAVVGSWATILSDYSEQRSPLITPTDSADIRQELLAWNCMIHPSVLIRRSALEQVGGYDESLRYAQDYDLWLRLAERFDMANIPECLLSYRLHDGQASPGKIRAQHESVTRAIDKAIARNSPRSPLLGARPRSGQRWAEMRGTTGTLGAAYLAWARRYWELGDPRAGLRLTTLGIRQSPFNAAAWRMLRKVVLEAMLTRRGARYLRWYAHRWSARPRR